MTFFRVVHYCLSEPGLVKEFNRLSGYTLGYDQELSLTDDEESVEKNYLDNH